MYLLRKSDIKNYAKFPRIVSRRDEHESALGNFSYGQIIPNKIFHSLHVMYYRYVENWQISCMAPSWKRPPAKSSADCVNIIAISVLFGLHNLTAKWDTHATFIFPMMYMTSNPALTGGRSVKQVVTRGYVWVFHCPVTQTWISEDYVAPLSPLSPFLFINWSFAWLLLWRTWFDALYASICLNRYIDVFFSSLPSPPLFPLSNTLIFTRSNLNIERPRII